MWRSRTWICSSGSGVLGSRHIGSITASAAERVVDAGERSVEKRFVIFESDVLCLFRVASLVPMVARETPDTGSTVLFSVSGLVSSTDAIIAGLCRAIDGAWTLLLDSFVPGKAPVSGIKEVADVTPPSKPPTADTTLASAEAVFKVRFMFPAPCDTTSGPGPSTAGMLRTILVDIFLLEVARARPRRGFVGGCSRQIVGASGVDIAGIFGALAPCLGFIFADSEEMSRVT